MSFSNPDAVEAAFYAAFRDLDEDRMRAVWCDSEETSCIHPGGEWISGRAQILSSWRKIFHRAEPPRIDFRRLSAWLVDGLAVHTVEETIGGNEGARGTVVLATNVYRYEAGAWCMLAHHASLPLVKRRTGSGALH